jgi:hypothetical protein
MGELTLNKSNLFNNNLLELTECSSASNYNDLNVNRNQGPERNNFIPKLSKKDLMILHQNITGLNNNKIDEISISEAAVLHMFSVLQNIIYLIMKLAVFP